MTSEASAVTPAASATVETPSTEMSAEQSAKFWETGELPLKSDSAPDKKPAVADPAPQKDKPAVTRSDSAPEKDAQEPHRKTKEDTERRFQELLDRVKKAEERAEAAEKRSTEKREPQQPSQPAPKIEEPQAPAPLKQFLEKFFAEEANKGKKYEDGVEAWQDARDKFKDQQNDRKLNQAIESDRQRQRAEASAQKLQKDFEVLQQRYPDLQPQTLNEIADAFLGNDIPLGIKQVIGGSDIFTDLVYVLGQDRAELGKLVELCKTNPTQALRKIINTESLVREQLKSNAKPSSDTPADKPAKTEAPVEQPKPRTPKPPAEVGGRGAVSGDAQVEAARSGNFAAFEAEQRRKYASR